MCDTWSLPDLVGRWYARTQDAGGGMSRPVEGGRCPVAVTAAEEYFL
jgi:hypothetical protein